MVTSATTGLGQGPVRGKNNTFSNVSSSKSAANYSMSNQKSPQNLYQENNKQNAVSSDLVGYTPEARNVKPRQIQSTDSQKRIPRNDVMVPGNNAGPRNS